MQGLCTFCILILLNVVILRGGVLSTCVYSIVLLCTTISFSHLYRNEQRAQLGCVFLGPVNWLTFKPGGVTGIFYRVGLFISGQAVQRACWRLLITCM